MEEIQNNRFRPRLHQLPLLPHKSQPEANEKSAMDGLKLEDQVRIALL